MIHTCIIIGTEYTGQYANSYFLSQTNIKPFIISHEIVTKIINNTEHFEILTKNNKYKTKTIIISTGSTPNKLPQIPDFVNINNNLPIAVIGGGNSACEKAEHLSKLASKVYLIHRRDKLKADDKISQIIKLNEKIITIPNSELIKVYENENYIIELRNNQTGILFNLPISQLYTEIGNTPNSKFVSDLIHLDSKGYIKTNNKMETNIKGIWAIGSVQNNNIINPYISICIATFQVEKYLTNYLDLVNNS